MQHRQLVRNSALLFGMNLVTGFLHYLFQVLAARRLDAVAYGRVLVAMNAFSLVLGLLGVIQFFVVLRQGRLRRPGFIRGCSWFFSLFTLGWALVYFAGTGTLLAGRLFSILCLSLPAVALLGVWLGVAQASHAFFTLGLISFLGGLFKFSGAFWSHSPEQLLAALLLGSGAALLAGLLLTGRGATVAAARERSVTPVGTDLFFSGLTAFGFALYPAFDLLNVRLILAPELVGRYGQLQLFSKVVYFVPIALLQVTFPLYVNMFAPGGDRSAYGRARRLEAGGLGLSYLAAFFFSIAGPWVSARFLGFSTSHLDIFLVCVSMVPLYGLMSALQLAASRKQAGVAVVAVMVVGLSFLGARSCGLETLRGYLWFSAVVNTVLGAGGQWLVGQPRVHK